MTCKDCIHYEACEATRNEIIGMSEKIIEGLVRQSHSLVYDESRKANFCNYFKDRSKFIELPCKVGQELYRVKHLGKGTVTTTSLNANTFWRIVMQGEFGRTVFLTKKEAEKALKEKEKNNEH